MRGESLVFTVWYPLEFPRSFFAFFFQVHCVLGANQDFEIFVAQLLGLSIQLSCLISECLTRPHL